MVTSFNFSWFALKNLPSKNYSLENWLHITVSIPKTCWTLEQKNSKTSIQDWSLTRSFQSAFQRVFNWNLEEIEQVLFGVDWIAVVMWMKFLLQNVSDTSSIYLSRLHFHSHTLIYILGNQCCCCWFSVSKRWKKV